MRLTLFFVVLCVVYVLLNPLPVALESTDRARLLTEIESLRKELTAREQEYLSPSAEDRAAFAGFLDRRDTGLIRLMPLEGGRSESKLSVRGSGAYYSFTRSTHEYGDGSDLRLDHGQFETGFAGADYGLISALGDLPIESVNLKTDGVQALVSVTTPSLLSEARAKQKQSSAGIPLNGMTYKNRAYAVVGITYALRSVNYGVSDVLVVFRAVRQDTDGSMILIWKLLNQFSIPTLVRDREQ